MLVCFLNKNTFHNKQIQNGLHGHSKTQTILTTPQNDPAKRKFMLTS